MKRTPRHKQEVGFVVCEKKPPTSNVVSCSNGDHRLKNWRRNLKNKPGLAPASRALKIPYISCWTDLAGTDSNLQHIGVLCCFQTFANELPKLNIPNNCERSKQRLYLGGSKGHNELVGG